MTTEVVKNTKKRLPNVGECWKHGNEVNVYMRIIDNDGNLVYPNINRADHFFSVDLNTGCIVWTARDASRIEILAPVGGVLQLQPNKETKT